jgi:hypothetical protein
MLHSLLAFAAVIGFASPAGARPAPLTWLGISGATGYSVSATHSHEVKIYAQNLRSLRRTEIGVVNGQVAGWPSAVSAAGVAATVYGPTQFNLTIFSRGKRSLPVAVAKSTECGGSTTYPPASPFVPLDMTTNGTLTFLERDASTGCEPWLMRRSPGKLTRRVWSPPSASPLVGYTPAEIKGNIALFRGASVNSPPVVYNLKTNRVIYTLPTRLNGFFSVRLITSDTLGVAFAGSGPKGSSAVRVDLRNHHELRVKFPHFDEAQFCGRYTFFASGSLVKVYDEVGRTVYRHSVHDVRFFALESVCSPKFAHFFGVVKGTSEYAEFLLSLTRFRARSIR